MNEESDDLRLPDELGYKMESSDEVIAAAALNRYLNTLYRKGVKQVFGSALKDDPAYPQGYLTDMIDSALSDAREALEEEQLTCKSAEAKIVREKCIRRLEVIYGLDIIENMSLGFTEYIVDCYEALPS